MKKVIKTVIAAAITTAFTSIASANNTACNQMLGGSLTRGQKLTYHSGQGTTTTNSDSSNTGTTGGTR